MRSEKPDLAGVVRTLLLNGAQRDVQCTLGNGVDNQTLTPLDLARRCDAGNSIIEMIQYGLLDRAEDEMQNGIVAEGPVRMYAFQENYICDICFNVSFSFSTANPLLIIIHTRSQLPENPISFKLTHHTMRQA